MLKVNGGNDPSSEATKIANRPMSVKSRLGLSPESTLLVSGGSAMVLLSTNAGDPRADCRIDRMVLV